jgi:hypothetical protein
MNPRLGLLQPYPFEKLRALLAGAAPPAQLRHISLGLGEPQHPTPAVIKDALTANLSGLARYPVTLGLPELRAAIAEWIARRHGLAPLDADKQIIPVNGSREALFSIAQTVLDPARRTPSSFRRTRSTRSTRARRFSAARACTSPTRAPRTGCVPTGSRSPRTCGSARGSSSRALPTIPPAA